MTLETTYRVAKLSIATLLLAMATAMPADATPIYNTCYELGGSVGYYEWAVDEHGNFTDAIYLDNCALDDLGAGPSDYEQVLEHEQGHAQGLSHSSAPSDTMYPEMLITGY
ncbi:MAG: matrixin family metalloprotease [Actinobacteria bacterium]|nr:matrixin family metalloprotease [Actinomycetota bacterium]